MFFVVVLEFRKNNFEFILHKHVVCFKLVVLDLLPHAWFWHYLLVFLDLNMFVYGNVTCWDKEIMF